MLPKIIYLLTFLGVHLLHISGAKQTILNQIVAMMSRGVLHKKSGPTQFTLLVISETIRHFNVLIQWWMIINCHLSFFLSFSGDTLLVCGCFWLSQCFRAKLLCPIKNELKLSWKVRAEKAKTSFGRCNTISLKCSTQTLMLETTVKSKNQFGPTNYM